ncbi:hypothetical protein LWI29_003001 [Acer saccharum]|uniref:Uncharacterized protein n=1 Tax=Acer saccharum TaxID=4024 RepID=A0AA39VAI1_ACESA|nr:hypothetical protein LWI29_003001 [Acer saccharum]
MENLGKSFHVMECRVMECHGTVMECNGMSCHGMSWYGHGMSWYGHGMSCNLRIWEDHGISFHVMENQGKSFHVMECRVMECNVMVRSWNIFVEAKLTPTEAEKGLWYYQGIAEVTDVDSSVLDVGIESQQDIAALDSALHDHTTVLDATGQSQLVPAASDTAQ